jgi:hypothetical protein
MAEGHGLFVGPTAAALMASKHPLNSDLNMGQPHDDVLIDMEDLNIQNGSDRDALRLYFVAAIPDVCLILIVFRRICTS